MSKKKAIILIIFIMSTFFLLLIWWRVSVESDKLLSISGIMTVENRVEKGNDNKYLVCYDFPEDYIWDQMICVDDRTAVLVKGSELFRAKRISDPEEDLIYNEIG